MSILLVGASGTIGRAVAAELAQRHDVIAAGRTSGDITVDITDEASIRAAYETIGAVDAVVSAAGHVKFTPIAEMHAADYDIGIKDKLMGQVNLGFEPVSAARAARAARAYAKSVEGAQTGQVYRVA